MRLILIRHGRTKGNLQKRYIGTTDENLCEWGIEELEKTAQMEFIQKIKNEKYELYASPLNRCIQTCHLLFADKEIHIEPEFREMNFGDFENKNYKELSGNEEYQKWIDSNGTLPFPNGESRESFIKRCCAAFENVISDVSIKKQETEAIVMVVHGGTIMAILDQYEQSDKSYYDYQCQNAKGYICDITTDITNRDNRIQLKIVCKL